MSQINICTDKLVNNNLNKDNFFSSGENNALFVL